MYEQMPSVCRCPKVPRVESLVVVKALTWVLGTNSGSLQKGLNS